MKVSFISWNSGHEIPQLKFFHCLPSLWFCSRSLSSPSRLYFHFCLVYYFSWLPPRSPPRCHFQPLLLLFSLYFPPSTFIFVFCFHLPMLERELKSFLGRGAYCAWMSPLLSYGLRPCLPVLLERRVLQPLAFATVHTGRTLRAGSTILCSLI